MNRLLHSLGVFLVISATFATPSFAAKEFVIRNLDDVDRCMKAIPNDGCYPALENYLKSHPKDHLKAARTLHRYFMRYLALEWFQGPVRKDKSICRDPILHEAFLEATGQDGKVYELARRFIEKDCTEDLLPVALKGLDRWSGPGFTSMVCPTLLKAGKTHKNCNPNQEPSSVPSTPAAGPAKDEKLPTIDRTQIRAVGTLKIFSGPEQSTLSLVKISHEAQLYLVKIEGTDTSWDGKVLLHREEPNEESGESVFWTEYESKRLNTLFKQHCSQGYCAYELKLPGMAGTKAFYFNEFKSKNRDPADLIRAFKN